MASLPTMPSKRELECWIQAEYRALLACDPATVATWSGRDAFKQYLIRRFPTYSKGTIPELEIRQLVNSGVHTTSRTAGVQKKKKKKKQHQGQQLQPLQQRKAQQLQQEVNKLQQQRMQQQEQVRQHQQQYNLQRQQLQQQQSQQQPQQQVPQPLQPVTGQDPDAMQDVQPSFEGLRYPIRTRQPDASPMSFQQVLDAAIGDTSASLNQNSASTHSALHETPLEHQPVNLLDMIDEHFRDAENFQEIQPVVHGANQPESSPAALNPKLRELKQFAEGALGQNGEAHNGSQSLFTADDQKYLLDQDELDLQEGELTMKNDLQIAVVFSADMLTMFDPGSVPQHGLLGTVCSGGQTSPTMDKRLFQNTNVPFSTFICGLQGSGKSHTLSCLIENCMIQSPMLGNLQSPLSAMVFHFSEYSSPVSFRPCEAAFLAFPGRQFPGHASVKPVNVLVAPSNYQNLKASYGQIPGVNILPFKLRPRDLNISAMLTLMSVSQSSAAPLYIGVVTNILRDMATVSPDRFDYAEFKRRLGASRFSSFQLGPLQQRLELLEAFLAPEDAASQDVFHAGGLTIMDLSCPFVDANMACVLFNIAIGMYLGSGQGNGKIIAVDEAHKYMTDTPASKVLTESLLSVIRQQRHFGVRVYISTQEPTISPRLMDLCSVTVVHRFTSPEWFSVLRRHISVGGSGIGKESHSGPGNQDTADELFNRILNLRVGEALVFAPSALVPYGDTPSNVPERLGSGLLKVKVRKRLTWDGGKSIVCND